MKKIIWLVSFSLLIVMLSACGSKIVSDETHQVDAEQNNSSQTKGETEAEQNNSSQNEEEVTSSNESEDQVVIEDRAAATTLKINREGMEESVHATLYKSHAQPVSFYIFDGYNAKLGAENEDYLTFTLNDKSYMNFKALNSNDFETEKSNLDQDTTLSKNVVNYEGFDKAFVYFRESDDGINISTILLPSEGNRPNILAVIHNPKEMENYDMYYEMLKTVEMTE
ncbi:LptM family lipoprotein [Neobacillus sp. D3-1R]|uniref:LptM family lipoprotein n=1 Tax=Neobacillus sp. D3-1R TaxID=3445778 RepID=UPI003FA12E7B